MRYCSTPVVILAFTFAGLVHAQDGAETAAREILDRAAKALGGADKLAGYKGIVLKGKGKFRQADLALEFEGETHIQDSERFRHDLTLNGVAALTLVLTGDQSWAKAGTTMPLPNLLLPLRFDLYAVSLSQRPHILKDRPFERSPLGEVQVEGKATLGIRVSRKGWPDVNLYYDKESGLPVKVEIRVTDPTSAQEVNDEFFLSEYREFDGLRHYTKSVGKRDGTEYLERELSEVRRYEQLGDDLFGRP